MDDCIERNAEDSLRYVADHLMGQACTKERSTLVLTGPVIGTVTDTTAAVLLEVDERATITCVLSDAKGSPQLRTTMTLAAQEPGAFALTGLTPDTKYHVAFEGLAAAQEEELRARSVVIKTLPTTINRLRLAAVSCDFPSRLSWSAQASGWSPWKELAEKTAAGEIDVMLHLGDQVYTWENGAMPSALRVMDLGLSPLSNAPVQRKMSKAASKFLQESYRHCWNQPWCAKALAHSSHLMIWSDNDVTNDFTCDFKADGTQTYDPAYLRVAMRVYESYQKQLRTPGSQLSLDVGPPPANPALLKEWLWQVYGFVGVFLFDMRGNLIDDAGVVHKGNERLGEAQKEAFQAALATPGVRCLVVGAEIPFVGPTPEAARKGVEGGLTFLCEHWPYNLHELTYVLDLLFAWKAAEAGREVVLLAGDIHVGVDSLIKDSETGLTIRHITTSPITNSVSPFFNPLDGTINERYSYTHKVLDGLHNYCSLDLSLSDDGVSVEAKVELIGVAEPKEPPKEVDGMKEPDA